MRETGKVPKPVHSISALQNGRLVLSLRITTGGRLHVQIGHE